MQQQKLNRNIKVNQEIEKKGKENKKKSKN